MAVFDWVESPGTTLRETPRLARTPFGDGYEERAPDGLHPLRQVWTVPFRAVDNAVADAIVAFFRARVSAAVGLETFDWTPLWHTVAIKVVCPTWTRVQGEVPGESDITAEFEQVFEP